MNACRRAILALEICARIVPGALFLAAGWSKAGQTMQTLASVYSYQIVLPDWLAEGIAVVLPWVEILLGAALLAGVWPAVTLSAAGAVLAGFTALTAQAWWRELPVECGCFDFGAIHPSLAVLATTGGATIRNLVLLALVALSAWIRFSRSGEAAGAKPPA